MIRSRSAELVQHEESQSSSKLNDLEKKYDALIGHNEELKSSLDRLKADFEKLSTAYDQMSVHDMENMVEIATLKQECDILKRRNSELERARKCPHVV